MNAQTTSIHSHDVQYKATVATVAHQLTAGRVFMAYGWLTHKLTCAGPTWVLWKAVFDRDLCLMPQLHFHSPPPCAADWIKPPANAASATVLHCQHCQRHSSTSVARLPDEYSHLPSHAVSLWVS